jgi:hypothetical protein
MKRASVSPAAFRSSWDELERENAFRRQGVKDSRDDDLVVALVHSSKRFGGLRLDAVVDLRQEDASNLVERLAALIAAPDGRNHRLEQRKALEIALHGLVDAGILNLHRDLLAATGHGAVDLSDAGRRERLALPFAKHVLRTRAEVFGDHPDGRLGREGRRLLLESNEDALELVLVTGRGEPVDVRGHLTELEG